MTDAAEEYRLYRLAKLNHCDRATVLGQSAVAMGWWMEFDRIEVEVHNAQQDDSPPAPSAGMGVRTVNHRELDLERQHQV